MREGCPWTGKERDEDGPVGAAGFWFRWAGVEAAGIVYLYFGRARGQRGGVWETRGSNLDSTTGHQGLRGNIRGSSRRKKQLAAGAAGRSGGWALVGTTGILIQGPPSPAWLLLREAEATSPGVAGSTD